ncbi:MAG: 50S ribosomal protein L11 methyltransferase [Pseudomonadales bacterium]|nr:50S ribosomal protein L11 methyltransferase [Candidatus Woesebacteria bacterium]MCB9800754.1 50S ribosomal protein L11 methyltransferase [Pseudomonadales bacterium]
MNIYHFLFGNTPEFSLAELRAVARSTIRIIHTHELIGTAELASDDQAIALLNQLGGTVKVIRELDLLEKPSNEDIIEIATKALIRETEKDKVVYGLAEIGRDHLPVFDAISIKNHLKNLGYKVQLKDGPRGGVPSALLLHKSFVQEICLIGTNSGTIIGKTVAVQNIDAWTEVDREKPYADRIKGMLPPKVARMMLNWGLESFDIDSQPVIYDPFCGSGTVLLEALAVGKTNLVGSDLDPVATKGTKTNIAWYSDVLTMSVTPEVMTGEVSKVTPTKKIDLIVTEPFLGKPRPNPAKVPYIFKGLERLYKGAFKHWTQVLADKATIVIVMPTVTIEDKSGKKHTFSMKKFIDSLGNLGYTTSSEPIEYSRSQAIVRRTIYKLEYNKRS